METDGFFQGDIAPVPRLKFRLRSPSRFWPNAIVPFTIHPDSGELIKFEFHSSICVPQSETEKSFSSR